MKAVVLGGGFAGMAAALRLALEGHEVVLLERDGVLGGKAQGWNGVPTGPTVLTMAGVVRALFARAGAEPPPMRPVSPLTTYTYPDGRQFAPELALEPTLAQLEGSEVGRYRELLEKARSLYEHARDTFVLSPPPTLMSLSRYALRHGLEARPLSSLHSLVQSGPLLTPFFLRFATYLGANPYKAPAVLHNIAWVELGMGVHHAEGGFVRVVRDLEQLLERRGVQIERGSPVKALERLGRRITGAITEKKVVRGEVFVSALDRVFTLGLLGQAVPHYPLGVSGFALLLQLEERFKLSHQVIFPQDYALEWADIASGRLPQDPTLYIHTDGAHAFVLVNSPPRMQPGKEGYKDFLLERLKTRLKLPIVEARAMAPQDYASFGFGGALYGRAPHGLLGTLRHPWTYPGLENLWQVGGTVHPGGGVPLSLLSGWNGGGQAVGLPFDPLGLDEPLEGAYNP